MISIFSEIRSNHSKSLRLRWNFIKRVASRKVKNLLSKRRHSSFLKGQITQMLHYCSQDESVFFEDGLLNFVEKQTKPSCVVVAENLPNTGEEQLFQ